MPTSANTAATARAAFCTAVRVVISVLDIADSR
jgi:hypothetical protein